MRSKDGLTKSSRASRRWSSENMRAIILSKLRKPRSGEPRCLPAALPGNEDQASVFLGRPPPPRLPMSEVRRDEEVAMGAADVMCRDIWGRLGLTLEDAEPGDPIYPKSYIFYRSGMA